MIEAYDEEREDRLTEWSLCPACKEMRDPADPCCPKAGAAAEPDPPRVKSYAAVDHAERIEAFLAERARNAAPRPCPYCPAAVKGGAPWKVRRVHDGIDHAARLVKESPWRPGVTLHQWDFAAACGATWTEEGDSGD